MHLTAIFGFLYCSSSNSFYSTFSPYSKNFKISGYYTFGLFWVSFVHSPFRVSPLTTGKNNKTKTKQNKKKKKWQFYQLTNISNWHIWKSNFMQKIKASQKGLRTNKFTHAHFVSAEVFCCLSFHFWIKTQYL